jgi:hypothetical protein
MANNYQESSSWLEIGEEKIGQAQAIIDEVTKEIIENDPDGFECIGCLVDVERTGVWFRGEESINLESVEAIAKELVERLEIDEPFYCSWAYTCSKPRIDEFGGGAFLVRRGKDTVWIDAMHYLQQLVYDEKQENDRLTK